MTFGVFTTMKVIVIQLVILAVGQCILHVYKLTCLVPLFSFASFYYDAVRIEYCICVSNSFMHFTSSLVCSQCIYRICLCNLRTFFFYFGR